MVYFQYRLCSLRLVTRQGRSQDFSKGGGGGGSQRLLTRLYMVYTDALPRVSVGSVVLSLHEGPY